MSKLSVIDTTVQQMFNLFGTTGVPQVAVSFARDFYIANNYYELLEAAHVEDIEGVTNIILVTVTQVFLSTFDLMSGVHFIVCTDQPTINDYTPIAHDIHKSMETFLHLSILKVVENAKRIDEPSALSPELRPIVNEILHYKYNEAMQALQSVKHDCNNCHIYKNKKECSIYNGIQKPFDYTG